MRTFLMLFLVAGGCTPSTTDSPDSSLSEDLGTSSEDLAQAAAACISPAHCTGCLTAGECVPGGSASACGTGGAGCKVCSAAQLCVNGKCETKTCNATNCTGCCDDANQQCLPGDTNLSCGKGGVACGFCQLQQSCNANGQCQGAGCAGCWDEVGICRGGDTTSQCGKAGLSCVACAANEQCVGGACLVPCNADNCSGCCVGNTCVTPSAQTSARCGSGGGACKACSGGATCGNCACQTPMMTACSGCTAGQCCDTKTGSCLRNANSTCGLNGQACVGCQSGTGCGVLAGMCLPPGPGAVGAACANDGDCAFGTNTKAGFCDTDLAGGYCSDLCSTTVGCGAGAECVAVGTLHLCLKSCTTLGSFNECGRAGYVCEFIDTAPVCVPQCGQAADCGNFPGVRCESFGGGNRCCGVASFACCPTAPDCSGDNSFGSRPSVCGENVSNYCS